MFQPLISIVVPCYNQAQYLDECLTSVLAQTYQNWECIIINDGSPDQTEQVAKKWVEKDSRFRYFKKENGGVSAARNSGIKKASGEWILPLDGDDRIAKDYLKLASEQIVNRPDVIYCKANFFGSQNNFWNLADFDYKTLLLRNLIFSAAIFTKESWEKICGYDENLIHGFEDWDFWISLLKKSNQQVIRLDYEGFFYRRKETSRDVDINNNAILKKETYDYIYLKHKTEYDQIFGDFFTIVQENAILKEKNRKLIEYTQLSILDRISKKIKTWFR